MKIEDLSRLPENAICVENTANYTFHIDQENENRIHSWFNNQGNLVGRRIIDVQNNGWTVYVVNNLLFIKVETIIKRTPKSSDSIIIGRYFAN